MTDFPGAEQHSESPDNLEASFICLNKLYSRSGRTWAGSVGMT